MNLIVRVMVVLLLLCFVRIGSAQIESGEEYDVYFLAGQSNAAGRGDAAELVTIDGGFYDGIQTDIQFYWRKTLSSANGNLPQDQFLPLQPDSGQGFNNPSGSAVEFGPEIALGRTLADEFPDRNIAIIKYAHGGSNLHTQWAAGGSMYATFLSVASDALNDITAAGGSFNLKGLVWVQGESDTGSTANSLAYEANLTNLISRFRNDVFGGAQAQIVVTRLSDNQYNNLSAGVLNVRAAQVAVAEADPNVEWVDSDGAEFSTYNISTPIHFDAEGVITMGEGAAAAFIDNDDPKDPPGDGSSVIVYEISSSTTFGNNGANQNGATTTFADNMDGTFTLDHGATGANNAVFINSTDSFNLDGNSPPTNNINMLTNAVLGRDLLDTDSVVISGTIDSTTGFTTNANGIEFGVISEFFDNRNAQLNGTGGFRSGPNLMYQIDDNGSLSGPAPFYGTDFNTPDDFSSFDNRNDFAGITAASLIDGFSFTATYTETSIVFEMTDIVVDDTIGDATAGDLTLTASLPASDLVGYSLLEDVGAGFAYLSFQDAGGGASYMISEFQIEVVPSFLLGDVNDDEVVNLLDVAPFVELLNDGGFDPAADINGDGVVNLLDVAPFVDLLSGA